MGSSEAEISSPLAMSAVIDELTKGCQSAATLSKLLLVDPPELATAKLLLEDIMSSISKTIDVLKSRKSQDHMDLQLDSLSSDVTSMAPTGKRSILITRKATTRKRGTPDSWKRVSSDTTEDGHTWRKYGQKEIFSSKHPRSYFRCTYKYDRGCQARKQVQKSEDCPFLYVITYFNEHTCDGVKEKSRRCEEESCAISFESNKVNGIKQEILFSSFQDYKQENEKGVSNLSFTDSALNCFERQQMELQKPFNSFSPSCDLEFMDLGNIFYDQNEFFTW